MTTHLITAGLLLVAAGFIVELIVAIVRDGHDDELDGDEVQPIVPAEYTPAEDAPAAAETVELDRFRVPPYVSRHHEDTVEIRPAEWVPLIGRARIAELTDTGPMDLSEVSA